MERAGGDDHSLRHRGGIGVGRSGRVGWGTSDAEVREAVPGHGVGVEEIASVDDDGIAQGLLESGEVECGELAPVGEDEQCVCCFGGGVGVCGEAEMRGGGDDGGGPRHGCGIVGGDGASFGEEHVDEIDGGRLSDVVGLALEGQPEDADAFATEGPEGGTDFIEEAFFLLEVDLFDLGEDAEVGAELLGDGAEGGYVFGETGAAVADAWTEEAGTDAAVETDAAGDLFHVGLGGLAEIGDCVDEGDLHGEEGVGGVLDDFRTLGGGEEERGRMRDGAGADDGGGLLVVVAG